MSFKAVKKFFLMILVKIFFYILSPIFLFFILLIKKVILIRFGVLASQRIGHFAWDTEIYLSEKQIKKKRNIIDLFCFTDVVCNKFLADKWKQNLIVIPSYILFPIIRLNNFLAKKNKFLNDHRIFLRPFDINNAIIKTQNKILFTNEEISLGENLLLKNGIDGKNIVCLIVRDSEYLKKTFPLQDFSYHNYRDCEIDSYTQAVKYLNDNGVTVIRMGRVVKKKMNYKNKLYIEYSMSKIESDFMDVFLASRCLFSISSGTGWEALPAFVFRKPMVFTNFIPFGQLITSSPQFINLAKKHYSLKLKRYLSISEIFKFCAFDFNSYKDNSIILEDNTADELKDIVEEMFNKIKNDKKYSDEENKLNSMFWNLYKKNLLNEDGTMKTWFGVKCHGNYFFSRYSVSFLKNNSNFLK